MLYLVAIQRRPNRQDLTGQIRGWKQTLNTLTMHYGDRIAAAAANAVGALLGARSSADVADPKAGHRSIIASLPGGHRRSLVE